MKDLNLSQILEANDYEVKAVDCPEWGGRCYVRTINSDRRDKFELAMNEGGAVGFRAGLVAVCLCDAEGKFLDPSDIEVKALGKKSAAPMTRLFNVCSALNGMRDTDVEEAEKN